MHSYERSDAGQLYCKPHFKQFLHENMPKANLADGGGGSAHHPGVVAFRVQGATCVRCATKVYAAEMMIARAHQGDQGDELIFHNKCFRCHDCNRGPLRQGDWVVDAATGHLLCQTHFLARTRSGDVPGCVEIA